MSSSSKQLSKRLRKELCVARKEYGKAFFQWQKEKRSLQMENHTLNSKIISLEQENKRAKDRINALLAELETSNVQIDRSEKVEPKSAARPKPIQSGMKQQTHSKTEKRPKDDYEVENILDHRFTKKQRKFLVQWKGYSSEYDTWEPETSLNCPKILKLYLKSKNIK